MRQSLLLAGLATIVVVITAQTESDTMSIEALTDHSDAANRTFPETFDGYNTYAYCAYPVSVSFDLDSCKHGN
jgi:expansin (peptidoglycan-binding protein)